MTPPDYAELRRLCDPSNRHGMPKRFVLQLIAEAEAGRKLRAAFPSPKTPITNAHIARAIADYDDLMARTGTGVR